MEVRRPGSTWQKMELAFDFSREDCPLLKDLGEIVEVLEGHALEMMGMVTGSARLVYRRVLW